MTTTRKNCSHRRPYAWKTARVSRSPFRTLIRARAAESAFFAKKSIGFTARSSLKSMGRIPRASGCYVLGRKYV